MRKGANIGIITGVSLAVLAGGGYGAYSLMGGSGDGSSGAKKPRTVVAEPPSADQAANGAKDFLAAWAAGDVAKAASLTDDPNAATTALTAFKDQVKPSALTLTPSGPATPQAFASATGTPTPAKPTGAPSASATPSSAGTPGASDSPSAAATPAPSGVLMGFKARAEFEGTARVWDYNGFLSVVKMSDDTPAVHWAPSVIHPHLSGNETISTQQVFAPPSTVVDRNGKSLQGASLTPALMNSLQDTARKLLPPDPTKDQDAGSAVVISDPAGKTTPDKLFTIVEPKPGKPFKVTIDNAIQAAAEKAMTDLGGKPGSIVAIEPSTGQVLAFANSPANGQNRAFLGLLAPGSTMKIVTSTALLEAGINPDSTVACPEKSSNPVAIPNDFPGAFPNNTLQDDFKVSCNTAFINQGLTSLKPETLAATAKDVYGVGLEWKTGLPNSDGRIPATPGSKDEQAMNYIGQGKVQMNPLAIASITATVQSGAFKQPILVAGLPQQPAARQISPDVAGKLRAMMNATATGGTAQAVMAGITDNAGAKTGSAEVAGAATTNSWFTAYRGNIAVAAEVQGGGHGVDAAGPAVASLLKPFGNR
ncbi:penicillin-binding transpeptidase domain-containing protein [Streptomyces sp. SP17BM10]|uniref:penicillin-binding transpeptidase domain-containing protein n=1 Tax=Streptomyces sp. SP17BM10 TaxID=3002530 RepID=UPI002E7A8BA9|nr:penicillin-binding transpeptidase domain-containing protein [Streptomyces sp. SP17BM10]MEE1788918.1 penicillin-binding transpeptidase domain-containing protein [Streptomyces sp. SP17BM10]